MKPFDDERNYDCPGCGDSLTFKDSGDHIYCRHCQRHYGLDPDAEFVDGMWRDLTTVREHIPRFEDDVI